jgi:2,5-diketo-D-gluconate reductase A
VVAYSPLGAGTLVTHPLVTAIANKAGCSPAQVLIAWGLSVGCAAVIPKTTQPQRIAEFAALAADPDCIQLGDEDMLALSELSKDPTKLCWDSSGIL